MMTREEYEVLRLDTMRAERAETERLRDIVRTGGANESERLLRMSIAMRLAYERTAERYRQEYDLAELRLMLAGEREKDILAAIAGRVAKEAERENEQQ